MKAEPIGFVNELDIGNREWSQEYLKRYFCLYNWKNGIFFSRVGGKPGRWGGTLGKDQEFVFHTQRCKIATITNAREPIKNFK